MKHEVPAWVTDGWYANNATAQAMAVANYGARPATTGELEANRAFVAGRSFPCVSCGLFAFPVAGTVCFWCTSGRAP